MPWSPKFEQALRAIAHGWRPGKSSLARISLNKAQKMLAEGKGK